MLKTKQMTKDLKRLKDEDAFVCCHCGSDDIEEKLWAKVNEYVVQNGKVYHEVSDNADDMFWCICCNDACIPISIDKYKEKKDAKQKS